MDLQTPVKDAGRAYKLYTRRLEKLGIRTLEDFLYHIPFRYENYSLISKISKVQEGEVVTIQGTVASIKNDYTRQWKTIQKAIIEDETGSIGVIWFNQPFLARYLKENDRISLSGKVKTFKSQLVMESPEYEMVIENKTIHTGRLVPIYNETRGVSSKWLRRQIYKIIQDQKQNILEYLPYSIIKNNNLISISKAIEQIHFPETLGMAKRARERLSFDELFITHLSSLVRRKEWEKRTVGNSLSISKFKKNIEMFWQRLPFELTNAQKRTVKEIFTDLAGKKPMNRLLEGDVGSGKTVVSAIGMYIAYLNGYQSVLMAPTEILANQHYDTISSLLVPFGVKVGLATSSSKKYDLGFKIKEKDSKIHKSKIINLKSDVLVGTHAVLSEKINFENLGLVVIDEQQRFGVEQRALIRKKGKNPHLLTMTATPIPRTVALTLYGDLDLSYLDEMPHGRKKVKTWLVPPDKRANAYKWVEEQLTKTNSSTFIICPFIEPSETLQTVKAAVKEFEYLQNSVFPNLKLGLLHGKIKSKDKDSEIQRFRKGSLDILVATPVVEVGIDIPNATIMVIEAAERFGLAQLHQLRGRVGRSDKQSYCLLFTESKGDQTLKRLKAMATMHVGAELAELDLKLRGPGELYGTMQHGIPHFKVASFSDFALIEKTRKEAEKVLPNLSKYPILIKGLKNVSIKQVSPD